MGWKNKIAIKYHAIPIKYGGLTIYIHKDPNLLINDIKKELKLDKTNFDAEYEFVSSMNIRVKNKCFKGTKKVVIGTITPPKGCGYFYSSLKNKMYGWIDKARGTNLKSLKIQLHNSKNKNAIVSKIENILKDNGILFVDVIDKCIRRKTYKDSDIIFASLDYKTINKVIQYKFINPETRILCNSDLAKVCFEIMNKTNLIDHEFISQRFGKANDWIKFFKD